MLLGEKLVNAGLVTQSQLEEALAQQQSDPDKKIGELLIALGHLDRAKLDEFLN